MQRFRIGNGYDVHRLKDGLQMHLGGVVIDSSKGFVAHSDGDVAIHALCDALLGAVACGDIGHHFPDNDPAYKGIDSRILLSSVMEIVRKEGYELGNADITIALQSPKIASRIDDMRSELSRVMGVEKDRVSIKATTTEKLGFVGREEGCAVFATVLVESGGNAIH